jgi:3-methyladenine DNA glycosylase AlkD
LQHSYQQSTIFTFLRKIDCQHAMPHSNHITMQNDSTPVQYFNSYFAHIFENYNATNFWKVSINNYFIFDFVTMIDKLFIPQANPPFSQLASLFSTDFTTMESQKHDPTVLPTIQNYFMTSEVHFVLFHFIKKIIEHPEIETAINNLKTLLSQFPHLVKQEYVHEPDVIDQINSDIIAFCLNRRICDMFHRHEQTKNSATKHIVNIFNRTICEIFPENDTNVDFDTKPLNLDDSQNIQKYFVTKCFGFLLQQWIKICEMHDWVVKKIVPETYSPTISTKKKQTIPPTIKEQVWQNEFGKFTALCACCKYREITPWNFECGHILAESKGGLTVPENMKPICTPCNRSMNNMHMQTYMKKHGYV